jgi:glyoxylase-like metal-dependent hydrolase (beta-lactamase superfamily II)
MKIGDCLYIVGSGSIGLSQAFDCHVFVVDCGKGVCVMVDSGAGEDPGQILKNMAKDGLDPHSISAILHTHSHLDHTGASAYFRKSMGCKVYIAAMERELLERGTAETTGLLRAQSIGLYSPTYPVRNCIADVALNGGETLSFGDVLIEVHAVPSHSPGSLCFFVQLPGNGRTLFTGDVVFADGVLSVLNMEGSSLAAYRKNLPSLSGLAVDSLMPGHGLFVVSGGQRHIDMAIDSLRLLRAPRNNL